MISFKLCVRIPTYNTSMKKVILLFLTFMLTACSGDIVEVESISSASVDQQLDAALELEEFPEVSLENLGPAPELENEIWLNTDGPLRLANLRGQVVLLDMWTFG